MSPCARPRPPGARGDPLAAVVLAAGTSSRMQDFKPLLPFGGATVLDRAIRTFLDAGVRDVVVVVGHERERLAPVIARHEARCVVNPEFDRGMYSSLLAGIRALAPQVEACFVLPADAPAVRGRTVAALARARRRADADFWVPAFQGRRGHPPLLSARLFPALLASSGEGGLRALLAHHAGREVPVLDEGVLLDLDTPADYAAACRDLGDRSVPTAAECAAILARQRVAPRVQAHGAAVAALAGALAGALTAAGLGLDLGLVRAGALLHDLAKGEPDHAVAGGRTLRRLGFARVAAVVAAHTDLPGGARRALDEAAVVYLADKLVQGTQPVALARRFEAAAERCRASPEAAAAVGRRWREASALAARVEGVLGGRGALAALVAAVAERSGAHAHGA